MTLTECLPPLTNVTILHLNLAWGLDYPTDYQQLRDTLSAIPGLIHLVCNNAPSYWAPGVAGMVLSTLQTFEYDAEDLAIASRVLVALEAPSLREMTIILFSKAEHGDEAVLCRPSNFPFLHSLHLDIRYSISPSDIRKLSRAFPYLVKITFGINDGAVEHMRSVLAFMQEDQVLQPDVSVWPRLRTLGLYFSEEEQFPMTELRTFLVERAAMNCPIQTLLLPESRIETARELSSCAVSPVTIAAFMAYVSPFLGL